MTKTLIFTQKGGLHVHGVIKAGICLHETKKTFDSQIECGQWL